MITEEKAQAYDEVLNKLKRFMAQGVDPLITRADVQDFFPELKESEDERIRRNIIRYLKKTSPAIGENIEKMLAWLEKQGESTDINPSEFDLRLNKLLKQFETLPKEELASSLSFYLNIVQNNGTYKEKKQGEQKLPIEKLSSEMKTIGESLGFTTQEECDKYNQMVTDLIMSDDGKSEQKPTDKEMKTLLRTEYEKGRADAIAEMQKPVDCIDCTNSKGCINCKDGNMKETLVQKTAWSEEDECYMSECIGAIATKDEWSFEEKRKTKHWLKSLNERVQPKEELSEENARLLDNCISLIEDIPYTEDEQNWLKSLRPQNRWKPTELQMDVLLDEVNAWTKGCPKQKVLESLYNDLKKLMEE